MTAEPPVEAVAAQDVRDLHDALSGLVKALADEGWATSQDL